MAGLGGWGFGWVGGFFWWVGGGLGIFGCFGSNFRLGIIINCILVVKSCPYIPLIYFIFENFRGLAKIREIRESLYRRNFLPLMYIKCIIYLLSQIYHL